MQMEDEDDDEGGNMGTVRYPCMPSLVALQQMRNRLHMAYLGRRLMKWTAMATGREMRKVAMEMNLKYEGYSEHVSECYIMMARARFYFHDMNLFVLENHPKSACLTVKTNQRSVAGCKITTFEVVNNEEDPYTHLGLEKGGDTISETKRLWRELVTKLIVMLNLRTAFIDIDTANRAATKKQNVLSKIVIPRTVETIRYILSELEEMFREDFFRLKKVMKLKYKNKPDTNHPNNKNHVDLIETLTANLEKPEEEINEATDICILCLGPIETDQQTDKTTAEEKLKVKSLKEKIREIVNLTKNIVKSEMITRSMEEFLLTADDVREKLEDEIRKEENKLCKKCKNKLVEDTQKFQNIPDTKSHETSSHESVTLELIDNTNETEKIEISKGNTLALAPLDNNKQISQHPSPPPDLGTFETEINEITKVVRTKNKDGTISEERKVIRIKKEIRSPNIHNGNNQLTFKPSDESSNTDHKTVGYVQIYNKLNLDINHNNENCENVLEPSKENETLSDLIDLNIKDTRSTEFE